MNLTSLEFEQERARRKDYKDFKRQKMPNANPDFEALDRDMSRRVNPALKKMRQSERRDRADPYNFTSHLDISDVEVPWGWVPHPEEENTLVAVCINCQQGIARLAEKMKSAATSPHMFFCVDDFGVVAISRGFVYF